MRNLGIDSLIEQGATFEDLVEVSLSEGPKGKEWAKASKSRLWRGLTYPIRNAAATARAVSKGFKVFKRSRKATMAASRAGKLIGPL